MQKIVITKRKRVQLFEFLELNRFQVEQVTDSVFRVVREDELPVFVHVNEKNLYFELDLGSAKNIDCKECYFDLLDLNTEILPVSLGIDTTNADDPRLVLVESREVENLDDNELLSVFDALELAVDKTGEVIEKYFNNK